MAHIDFALGPPGLGLYLAPASERVSLGLPGALVYASGVDPPPEAARLGRHLPLGSVSGVDASSLRAWLLAREGEIAALAALYRGRDEAGRGVWPPAALDAADDWAERIAAAAALGNVERVERAAT